MSQREVVDELRAGRFDALASPELRARVREIAADAPERRPSRFEHFSWRRTSLVLVPAALTAVAAVAVVQGLAGSGGDELNASQRQGTIAYAAAEKRAPQKTEADQPPAADARALSQAAAPEKSVPAPKASALPPGRRLTDYRVRMRVRLADVNGLSKATVSAMRITRRYGGYVVSVAYSTPGAQHGDAVLLLRVPNEHMQTALLKLSSLGTIVSQAVSLVDLQKVYNAEAKRLGVLATQVGRLRTQLQNPDLDSATRERLQEQLEYQKLQLNAVAKQHRATRERGNLGLVTLSLTTSKTKKAVVPVVPQEPTRFDRALEDAGAILAKELTWGLYAGIVAAPFLILLAFALFGGRARRRQSERALLARSG
jgi:hypothetical protein